MNLISRSLPELTRAASTAQARTAATQGWQDIPHINQLHPQGEDKGYVNGPYNCAPAVVAMLARGYGRAEDMSDAELIDQLGQGIVTKDGTDADGMARMLARVDVPPAGDALGANYKDSELKQQLNQGHMVIAQVRTSDPKGNQDSAHYVLVQGMTKDGNYIVSDPLAKKPYVVTPKQLKEAVLKAPPDGGMLIPVMSPSEAKKLAAPAAPAASTSAVDPSQAAGGGAAVRKTAAPVDAFDSVATAAPDPTAFTASDDVFEGVDTRFQNTAATQPTNAAFVNNEKKNQFQFDVRYGGTTAPAPAQTQTPTQTPAQAAPVTPGQKSADEFAQELRDRKAQGDMSAYDTLDKLETSTDDKDRQVLEKVKDADKKDPGIGKKTLGDAF